MDTPTSSCDEQSAISCTHNASTPKGAPSPSKHRTPGTAVRYFGTRPILLKQEETMVVSDSEEERQRRIKARRAVLASVDVNELPVIEISSDEEDTEDASVVAQKGSSQVLEDAADGLALLSSEGDGEAEDGGPAPTPRGRRNPCRTPRARRVVVSSDSEDSDPVEHASDEGDAHRRPTLLQSRDPASRGPRRHLPSDDDVIDLTMSSPEQDSPRSRAGGGSQCVPEKDVVGRGEGKGRSASPIKRSLDEGGEMIPLYRDDDDDDDGDGNGDEDSDDDGEEDRNDEEDEDRRMSEDPFAMDDGSILVLNEPRSARKPILRAPFIFPKPPASPFTLLRGRAPTRESQTPGADDDVEEREDAGGSPSKPRPKPQPKARKPPTTNPSPGKAKAPRKTKKVLEQEQRERLRAYADAFFKEMNESVFRGGIPADTKLVWSNRLRTTAGRAHWKRDRHGVHETSIQLAEKVLDCEERIRHTLSHEMCHLACWIISDAPDEQHGAIFKGWGRKVMSIRSDVKVSTKHDYEIHHQFQWKCATCNRVYGRHSKSIHPDKHVCGGCAGQLVPLFTTRGAPKTPKTTADSQNAANRNRDSPLVMPGAFPASPAVRTPKESTLKTCETIELSDDSDVEILAHTLNKVQIKDAAGI
ncbi:SprT-like family-domain-containing protein [Trametes elegans]|nr:SprT-like family-domain-containing protein [Trametes elegans]